MNVLQYPWQIIQLIKTTGAGGEVLSTKKNQNFNEIKNYRKCLCVNKIKILEVILAQNVKTGQIV